MIPGDVDKYIARTFGPQDQVEARALLQSAVIHDGSAAEPRLLRCAVVASEGSIERLRMEIESLKRDFRDVIVEGEYAPTGGKLARVRNLNDPIPDN